MCWIRTTIHQVIHHRGVAGAQRWTHGHAPGSLVALIPEEGPQRIVCHRQLGVVRERLPQGLAVDPW